MITGEILQTIFQAGIDAVDPHRLILRSLQFNGVNLNIRNTSYLLSRFNKIVVVGTGKATAPMAQAVEDILRDRISQGLIIVKYGHTRSLKKIKQIEAGHPLPDKAGVKGTEEILKLLTGLDEKTLVICLLSGGGSSLLVSPANGITLNEKKEVNKLLLSSGARIDEINAVRKHLSRVKGGRLAEAAYPATLITLILSDVIGDRADVIASGPTVPDTTTFKDVMEVIRKYNLEDRLPEGVMRTIERGIEAKIKDTPKGDEVFFEKSQTVVIGSLKYALAAAMEKAVSMDFETEIITSELQGEAKDAARYLSTIAIEVQNSLRGGEKSRCFISGGETTVTVKGKGLGGRNQELALAFAIEIEGIEGITMLSAGTDGTDGPTDAAGAIVDGNTVIRAKKLGLDPNYYLAENDSYNFLKKLDLLSGESSHVIIGPTGTNVMDMQVILVDLFLPKK
ncbi:MAG: glycerate kinase [Nitrospinae bacterium]|nr:glycerate kinase [Nitrospinota bacterium]